MLKKKNHIGRPSNKEIRARKNKKMFIAAISIVFVLLVVGMFETGSLSKLMGNSVTEYYCEDGYKLKGDKCTKIVTQPVYQIGDVNQDGVININDVTTIQRYLAEFITFDDYQMILADVNQDGNVNMADATILQKYMSDSFSGTMSAEHHIGEKICPKNDASLGMGAGDPSELSFCPFKITVNAMTKVRDIDYQMGDKVTYKGMDFYVIENTDKDSEYVNLLKAETLTGSEIYKSMNINGYNENIRNDGSVKYALEDNCSYNQYGALICTADYEKSYVKKVVDDWVNKYIDKEDLSSDSDVGLLDYNITDKYEMESVYGGGIKVPYSWLITRESYWLMNGPIGAGKSYVEEIRETGYIYNKWIGYYNKVRPVITLKKSAIGKAKEKVDYKAGSKVKYNRRSYYVLNDSMASDDSVTLITLKPLTRAQLTTFTKGMNVEVSGFTYNNYGAVKYGDDTSFETSVVKQIVDKWAAKVAKSVDLVPDSTGYRVRIPSYYNDLINKVTFTEDVGDLGKIDISWLKNECWTMTPSIFENADNNYMVVSGDDGHVANAPLSGIGVVCPVITVKKSVIK